MFDQNLFRRALNTDARLNSSQVAILAAIEFRCWDTGRLFASQATLAAWARMGVSTVKRQLPGLVELGYLEYVGKDQNNILIYNLHVPTEYPETPKRVITDNHTDEYKAARATAPERVVEELAPAEETPELEPDEQKVLELIRAEGTDRVMHSLSYFVDRVLYPDTDLEDPFAETATTTELARFQEALKPYATVYTNWINLV